MIKLAYFKYPLDTWPPPRQLLLFGLQWFMLTVPIVIIIGKTVGGIQYPQQPELQLVYLQKLFLAVGVTSLLQLLFGHRLPLVVGPASVLLIGLAASYHASATGAAIYSSMAVCGLIVAALSQTGLLSKISGLFTTRIIGVVLLLIAFTMLPTILALVAGGPQLSSGRLLFAVALLSAMLAGQRLPAGLFRSTLIIWALLAGSLAYYIFVAPAWPDLAPPAPSPFSGWELSGPWTLDYAVLISFLFCYLALVANDIGSIQTTAKLLSVPDAGVRTKKGLILTGFGNILSGLLGVIGPVNYSFSAGLILSSGCASRYTLLPAAAGMIALSAVPAAISLFSYIPSVVVGVLLFYTMCSQIAGGLGVLADSLKTGNFDGGLVIGVSLMTGTLVAFLPHQLAALIPAALRPLLTNGFVVGVIAAFVMEHLIIAKQAKENQDCPQPTA